MHSFHKNKHFINRRDIDMKKKKKRRLSPEAVERICILVAYIVMYGSMTAIGNILSSNSTAVYISFSVICMFFAYKSCKGRLVSSLNFLPPPAVILLSIMLAQIIGLFTAPYHIAKWVAKKINAKLKSLSNDDDDD